MAQKLNPNRSDNRGGKRKNAGRPKLGNVSYRRMIKPEFVVLLDKYLEKLKLS